MDERICAECGFKVTGGEDICPECGCPLNKTDTSVEVDKSQSRAPGELQEEVNNDGCIATWRKHCSSDAIPVKVFNILDSVLGWSAIILTVFVVVYFIVRGITLNSDEKLYLLFKQQAMPFAITIIILYCSEKISETIANCMEVSHTSQWLSANGLDTSDCLELKRYGKTKKNSLSFSVHNIEVAYCGSHSEYVSTSIARTVGKCVLYIICTVIFGFFLLPVIEQYILDVENLYIFAGYFAGSTAVEFLHWLIRRIIDKNLYNKVDEWRMRKK